MEGDVLQHSEGDPSRSTSDIEAVSETLSIHGVLLSKGDLLDNVYIITGQSIIFRTRFEAIRAKKSGQKIYCLTIQRIE